MDNPNNFASQHQLNESTATYRTENKNTPQAKTKVDESRATYMVTPINETLSPDLHPDHLKSLQSQASEKINKLLTKIVKTEPPKSIRYFVAQQALKCETPESYFHDLLEYGCTITMIMKAMKTTDEQKFFNDYYSEIDCIRHRINDIGVFYKSWSDPCIWLSGVAVEVIAYYMADEIGTKIDLWHLSPVEVAPRVLDMRQPLR